MALSDQYALSVDAKFRNRLTIALATAAVAVMAEDAGTTNHAARVLYAHSVLHNTTLEVANAAAAAANTTLGAEYASAVAANMADPQSNVTDNDLQFTVNSLFDALAA